MSTKSIGLVLAGLLVATGSAFADQFKFLSSGTTIWNSVYVNPYLANDNSQTQNNPLTIYCDDWNTDFTGTPTWNANVYTLSAAHLSNFKYGNTTQNYNVTLAGNQLTPVQSTAPSALDRYLEAAWLDEQWQLGTDHSVHTQIALAAAEWTLFVNSTNVAGLINAINKTGYAQDVFDDLQKAQTAVAGGYKAPGWDVIVPTGNTFQMQEFLVYGFTGHTSTPEPGTVILLGTITGFLGLAKWRRNRRA